MAELLAKPDTGLITHLSEVTHLGARIAERLGLPEKLRVKAILACAFHDIGKATTGFQDYIRGRRKKAYPHALASLPFVLLAESLLGQHYGWERHNLESTAAVLTHHSPLGPGLYKGFGKPFYEVTLLLDTLRELWVLLNSHGVKYLPAVEEFWQSVKPFLADSPVALLDNPMEIGSERRTLRGILQCLSPKSFTQVKTVLHLADWLASAKIPEPTHLFLNNGRSLVERHMRRLGSILRRFQQQAAESRSRVLRLRAPTGTGKTEGLLLWAGDAERLIYLLPTQATTNAMWRRLQRIYGEESVGLAHGRARYILRKEVDENPLEEQLFGSVFAKPVTVATLDQYLLAHLHGRHWEERRSLACGATMVLDEIHAYEPYTLGLLLEALKRERPKRLALASATLPEPLLELFPQGELIEAEPEFWRRVRHHLKPRNGELLKEGVDEAVYYARKGKRVLVVANTVQTAQEFYRRLQKKGWKHCSLLHARFILRDRADKEVQVGTPKPGVIFVSTQVVEVSLDISYDVLLTELAPMDALVQRMGRVNRRGEGPPSPVLVYRNLSEGSRRIYGDKLLELSAGIIAELPPEPTDRDLACATHQLYEQVISLQEWRAEFEEGRLTLEEVQRTLGCYTINLSDEEMRERFTTRRGIVSVEVLPAQFMEEAYRLREQDEGWRLVELMVLVPIWWFRAFPEQFCEVSDLGLYTTYLPYNSELGLEVPQSGVVHPGCVILD